MKIFVTGALGFIGRALLLLERAVVDHPDSVELRRRLDDLRLFYDGVAPSAVESAALDY